MGSGSGGGGRGGGGGGSSWQSSVISRLKEGGGRFRVEDSGREFEVSFWSGGGNRRVYVARSEGSTSRQRFREKMNTMGYFDVGSKQFVGDRGSAFGAATTRRILTGK